MIFSIMLCRCAEVSAGDEFVKSFGAGNVTYFVTLASDRTTSTGSSNLNASVSLSTREQGTYNENSTKGGYVSGTTSESGSVNGFISDSSIESSSVSGGLASYQLDFVFSQTFYLGRWFTQNHNWTLGVNAGNPRIRWLDTSYAVDISSLRYGAYVGGKRYDFGNQPYLIFAVDSNTTFERVDYFAECSIIVTVPANIDFTTFRVGLFYDSFRFTVTDNGTRNNDVVGAVNDGNDIAQQGNQIAQEGNNLQKEQNDLQKEQNQTSKNIFDKISDFFGSFFQNIINAFKSLFIPENGYFEDFFKRLNTFFAEKLGMLYAPIDMFIRLLNSIAGASGGDAGIMFPGIQWEGQYILQPQKVSLSTIAGEVPELQEKIYFVTDIIMVGSVLMLLQNKLREVMQN